MSYMIRWKEKYTKMVKLSKGNTILRTNTEFEKENRTTQKTGKAGWVTSGSPAKTGKATRDLGTLLT